MKTHFDRSLVDNTSESRAWLIGMTCIGVVLVLSLGGYQLVQQSASSQARGVESTKVAAPSPPVKVVSPPPTSPASVSSPPEVPEVFPESVGFSEPIVAPDSIPSSLAEISKPVEEPPVSVPSVSTPPTSAPEFPESVSNDSKTPLPTRSELETRFAPGFFPRDDSYYENALVRIYRKKHPDDPMSNRELTESMGDHYKTRGNFIDYAEKFPDWARLYNLIKKESLD